MRSVIVGGLGHSDAISALAGCATHPILRRMKLPDELLFASDAEMAAIVGAGFLVLAAATSFAERRRVRRERIDRVGWVPWTGLFLVFAVIGFTLVGLGAMGLIKG